jgi:1-acyl-sn-glycerol-3-phosphate acyltransferase
MHLLRILLQKTWRFLFFVNGVITFFVFFPFFYIFLSREKWFEYVFRLKKMWGWCLIYFVGIRHRIIRQADFDPRRTYVICGNHASYLDIILMYLVVPGYFHFMGKAELQRVPFFNRFFKRMNILVDRGSIISSHRAFLRAGSDIDKGISIAIFPEATIPESAPRLGRFKNGAFRLAIEKQTPILPVVFLDNWKILPDNKMKKLGGRPGLSRIMILDPVETAGMKDSDLPELRQRVFTKIDTALKEYDYGNK